MNIQANAWEYQTGFNSLRDFHPNVSKTIKGQLTVPGLLIIFLMIMVLSKLMPSVTSATNETANNLSASGYVEEAALVKLIPMFVVVVLLASLALYSSPQP